MTTFLLIRHAAHLLGPDTIAGRTPDVHLSPLGRDQAAALGARLGPLPIRAIYCSPIDRARETAEPLAAKLGLPVQISEAITEIDFGEWSGAHLDQLRPLQLWRRWNEYRSGTRIPGGELMIQTQARIVAEMERLRARHPDECIALVSHGDVIKAAVAHCLGVHLDLFRRIEISLASMSVIKVGDLGPWVLCVNNTADIIPLI
jgi:probable phosphomutase (TIGR03848 family)